MRMFGDRFLRIGKPRSFAELQNSARIENLGLATPRVVAAAVYPHGLIYRADLVTEFVPEAQTLAEALFGRDDPWGGRTSEEARRETRREALICARDLVTRLSRCGVVHPDLNAGNILIAREGQRVHAILLDLDGCRVEGPSNPALAWRLRRRLARSIRKLQRTHQPIHGDGEEPLTINELTRLLGGGRAS